MARFQAYRITCHVNGKQYIGVTTRDYMLRWGEHVAGTKSTRGILWRAIRKHDPENFTVDLICESWSWEDLCVVEKCLIRQHGTMSPNGYNLTIGGEGVVGYNRTPEDIERSAAKHRGIKRSPELVAMVAARLRGVPKTPIHRQKISRGKMGQRPSSTTRLKMSRNNRAARNVGDSNPGAKLSPSQVDRIRSMVANGVAQRTLAKEYGVSATCIWKLVHGLKWKAA